jgi:hypothetical protein
MSIDLSSYGAIATGLFCKIVIPNYQTLNFSNYNRPVILGSDAYTGLGSFMDITETVSELKNTNNEVTITISGVSADNINNFLSQQIKGSSVTVLRGIFDPTNGQLLAIAGNPVGRFYGFVNNYAFNETWGGQDASNTITLICKSQVGLLQTKIAGRRTNPIDQKFYYPTDTSMDRVPSISLASINFGGK